MGDASDELTYDAFLSYSSRDLKVVGRLQRLLQSYRTRRADHTRQRVCVFLDRTDIRGGDLSAEIGAAISRSRVLVICVSPAAVDSKWVQREIDEFRRQHPEGPIASALIAGEPDLVAKIMPSGELRFHDLRGAWWLGMLRPRAKLELLRLLAFVTDVDLRSLRNWWLRRTLAQATLVLAVAIGIPAAILLSPVQYWRPVPLMDARRSVVYPIASEVHDDALRVAARFQGQGPQGFRNYIAVFDDAFGDPKQPRINDRMTFQRRLLPEWVATFELGQRARQLLGQANMQTDPPTRNRPIWVGEPRRGTTLVLAPIAAAREEIEEAEAASDAAGYSITPVAGTLVIVNRGDSIQIASVRRLDPRWTERLEGGDPASPSSAIAVAYGPGDLLWLGVPARADHVEGGLWRSADAGASWQRVEEFTSVGSLVVVEGHEPSILVSESHHSLWDGGLLRPRPARVVRVDPSGKRREAPRMPPLGTRSEVELAGVTHDGELIVRVDETIFKSGTRPLWRAFATP